ncbi:MAG: hypothetical protein ACOYXC_16180 [Candidatus Rifleibacteriota bacterium]
MIIFFSFGFYLLSPSKADRGEALKNALISGFLLSWLFWSLNSQEVRLKPPSFTHFPYLFYSTTSLLPITSYLFLDDILNFIFKKSCSRWDYWLRIFILTYLGISSYVRIVPTDATAVLLAGTIAAIIFTGIFNLVRFRKSDSGAKV